MRPQWTFALAASGLLTSIGITALSCGDYYSSVGSNCTLEEAEKFGCSECPVTCKLLDGGTRHDGSADAAGSATAQPPPLPRCAGQCVIAPPLGWSAPALLWTGPEDEAPTCPEWAPVVGYRGHDELVAPKLACTACACESSEGTCSLPTTMTAHSSTCPGTAPGSKGFDFNPSSTWNGACTTTSNVAAGNAQSLTIGPVTISEEKCRPVLANPTPTGSKPTWNKLAVACISGSTEGCPAGKTCAPLTPAPPPNFSVCIYQAGAHACPESYPDSYIFYGNYEDHRGCAACTCSPPKNSSCTATVSVFKDNSCSAQIFKDYSIDSKGPACTDIKPAGSPLVSKSASPPVYKPGTCTPSGGNPTGSAVPVEPSTFCCR